MNVNKTSYFEMEVDDQKGKLSECLTNLRESNVDLAAMWVNSCAPGKASMWWIPKDKAAFKQVAEKCGWTPREGTAFQVTSDDKPGSLVDLFDRAAKAGISLKGTEAVNIGNQFTCFFWGEEGTDDKLWSLLQQ